jgi:hypothetical protein
MKQLTKFTLFCLLATVSFVLSNCSQDNSVPVEADENYDVNAPVIIESLPGRYIVVLKSDNNLKGRPMEIRGKAKGLLKRYEAGDIEPDHVYSHVLQGFSVGLNQRQMEMLQEDQAVDYIELDQTITLNQGVWPLAPGNGRKPDKGSGGSDEEDPSQTIPYGTVRVGGAQNGTGKVAWIIDSGIDQDHPDLNVDNAKSKSFLSGKQSTNPDDQHGHGTHVAGTVAAIDNTIGSLGVAAGATVVAVRVLDRRGSGTTSGVIAGVDYVAANASANDAANMSLGGGISSTLDNAVIAASAVCPFALAAGNESDDAKYHSPARANGTNIYTISAMDSNDDWAYFSNYGAGVDYCASGVGVFSCWKNGGYNSISGTSMASPHVCGLLLMGTLTTSGYVNGDPDGNADPIAHK